MKIRKATLDDAVALARLHRSTIRHVNKKDYPAHVIKAWSGRSSARKFRKLHAESVRFVAVEKGKIIGFGELIKDSGNLGALYVHKNWLRKGVGKKLFLVLEKTAKKQGVKEFEFESSITAKDFYERCGCKTVKKMRKRLRKGPMMTAYLMKKDL